MNSVAVVLLTVYLTVNDAVHPLQHMFTATQESDDNAFFLFNFTAIALVYLRARHASGLRIPTCNKDLTKLRKAVSDKCYLEQASPPCTAMKHSLHSH